MLNKFVLKAHLFIQLIFKLQARGWQKEIQFQMHMAKKENNLKKRKTDKRRKNYTKRINTADKNNGTHSN